MCVLHSDIYSIYVYKYTGGGFKNWGLPAFNPKLSNFSIETCGFGDPPFLKTIICTILRILIKTIIIISPPISASADICDIIIRYADIMIHNSLHLYDNDDNVNDIVG